MSDTYEGVRRLLGKHKAEMQLASLTVLVTPELAQHLLTLNENIRNPVRPAITRYAADMMLDRWQLTGEAIIFDWFGNLKNGQNRLEGCVLSGRPFVTQVILGVDPRAELDMDIGAKRTLPDYLGKQGFHDTKSLAAALRLAYQMMEEGGVSQDAKYTNEILFGWFLGGHKSLEQDLTRCRLWDKDWPKGFTRAHAAGVRHVAGHVKGVEIEDVDTFFAQLAQAVDSIDTRSPAFLLYRLFTKRQDTDRIQLPDRIAMTIKALNASISGEDISAHRLQWRRGGARPEPFPKISPGVVAEGIAELEAELG